MTGRLEQAVASMRSHPVDFPTFIHRVPVLGIRGSFSLSSPRPHSPHTLLLPQSPPSFLISHSFLPISLSYISLSPLCCFFLFWVMNYCVALFTLGSFILSIHVLICKLWLITAFVIISIIYFKAVHQAFGQALLTLFDLLYVQCLFAKKNYHISQPCVSSVKPCCYFPGASASGMVVGKKKRW